MGQQIGLGLPDYNDPAWLAGKALAALNAAGHDVTTPEKARAHHEELGALRFYLETLISRLAAVST